ncbi:MAG: hypothetical protein H7Y10_03490 [Flavobacterium sp.]|nr:hypothetical protein [Flavobacterium sp.]
MSLLTKELFISTIDSLQGQVSRDIAASNAISQVFDTDAVYDNSLLVTAMIKLLQLHFPKDANGFCEIEHYCFDMNFGKIQGEELITSEDLWDRLNMVEVVVRDCTYKFTPWEMLNDPDLLKDIDLFQKATPSSFDGELKNRFLLDEAGQWPTKTPELKGVLQYMTSTHPLIDDNPNPDGV